MDAKQKIEAMPPLPEMANSALVEGHQGSEYRTLSNNYAPGHAMFSERHMHTYAREYAAQTLASKDDEIARLKADALSEKKTAFYEGYGQAHFDADNGLPPVIEAAWKRAYPALTQPTE